MTAKEQTQKYLIWCAIKDRESTGVTRGEIAKITGIRVDIVGRRLTEAGWGHRVLTKSRGRKTTGYAHYRPEQHVDTLELFA